jgi:flagellar biogenesis protein FliO
LSILLPLIGFGEAKQRAFIKSENQIFKWFLGFIIIMGILMMSAVFVGKPHTIYNSEAIYGSQYFKNSIAWRPGEFDFPTGLTSLYITPNTNYWILFGITMFGALAIVVFGVYTTKKIFFRQALHAQSLVRHKK